jgi:putative acetyltransferase
MRIEAAIAFDPTRLIRPATAADLPACAAIINDYIDATDWLPRIHPRETLAGFFSPELLERRKVYVAELDGQVVGYMTMSPKGLIPALYLAPSARGQGIGKALIDRAKAESPHQVELTMFQANHDARRFYEREGFREVPEGRKDDAEEGIPILLMRWRPAA